MNKLFDIACNFTSKRFDNDLNEVIEMAIKNDVNKFALICSQISDFEKLINIYEKYKDFMVFTLGIHPHNAGELNQKNLKILRKIINDHPPHAVGETGLDFYRNLSSYEEQIYAFEEQIKIAIEINKPLFLHQRDSHNDFIKILRKYSSNKQKKVVHCFTGTQDQLDDYLKLDCYIGITGWICDEKRNVELRKTIKNIPLSKLMVETDCPYLIPKDLPNKPKDNRNEPFYMNHIVKEIAKMIEVNENALRKQTFENSLEFFR